MEHDKNQRSEEEFEPKTQERPSSFPPCAGHLRRLARALLRPRRRARRAPRQRRMVGRCSGTFCKLCVGR